MWFWKKKKDDPLKTVDDIYREVEAKFNARLTIVNENLKDSNELLQSEQKKNAELTEKVREQTDADLFLLCKKIEKKILEDKKPSQEELSNLRILQNQQASLAQQSRYYGLRGIMGSSGLFGQSFR